MNQVLERRYTRVPQATGVRRLILLFLLSTKGAGLWSIVTVSNGWVMVPSTIGPPASIGVANNWRTPQRDVAGNRRAHAATAFLFGNTTIESKVDVSSSGSVEAFPFVDRISGVVSEVAVYVDSRTKAKHQSLRCIRIGAGSLALESRSDLANRPPLEAGIQSKPPITRPRPVGRHALAPLARGARSYLLEESRRRQGARLPPGSTSCFIYYHGRGATDDHRGPVGFRLT